MDQPLDLNVGANAMVVLPQGDADDGAGTSAGTRAAFQAWFHPNVAFTAAMTYVFVNEEEVYDAYDLTFYSIEAGVRYRGAPRPVRAFGELLLGRHTIAVDGPGVDDAQSDLGLRLGGGVELALGGTMSAVFQASYLSVEIENADLEAFTLEAGLSFHL